MDVLVLSPAFEPIARATYQQALIWYFTGRVDIVESYSDKFLRSPSVTLAMPSVVRHLRGGNNWRRRSARFSKENIYARDRGACQYCGKKLKPKRSTFDHVTPRVQGGKTLWTNIVLCCTSCNIKKGGRTPEQAGMVLRAKPVKPSHLPDYYVLTFRSQKQMPMSWKVYFIDTTGWDEAA